MKSFINSGKGAGAVIATLAIAGAGLGIAMNTGGAGASVNPAKYTNKGTAAVAGYYAQTLGGQVPVGFTHIASYLGNDGQSNQEKFDVNGASITNGGGVGLCDQTTGRAAQVGESNVGGGLMDVNLGVGQFTAPALNNGDICENGIINPVPTQTLLSNVPVNDTVAVNLLYDAHHAHNGCSAGQVLAIVQDLSANGPLIRSNCYWSGSFGTEYTEADAGVVADNVSVAALPGQGVPQPDVFKSENLLMVWAHVFLNGNYLTQSGEVHGSFQNSPYWTITPVASTSNGDAPPAGSLLMAPGVFKSDHFRLYVGDAIG